jgi:3-oxoacyl-[acyl-carrier-protein] synthase-3
MCYYEGVMKGRKAKLTGVGTYIPPAISNDDFIRVFGRKAAAVDRMIPHKSRYLGIDIATGRALTTNTDMAVQASLKAVDMAGIAVDDIDMIIYASASPDYLLPTCFTSLQAKLKIRECMGMDIRSGCSGFGAAFITAEQYIKSGMVKAVLVVGSELNSTRASILYQDDLKKFPLKALFNLTEPELSSFSQRMQMTRVSSALSWDLPKPTRPPVRDSTWVDPENLSLLIPYEKRIG